METRSSRTHAASELTVSPGVSSNTTREYTATERRAFPRVAVDCPATVTLLSGAGNISARLTDLSRGGCRLATSERVSVSIMTRVEVSFVLRGYSFRLVGVSAGSRRGKSFAVRFLEMPRRRAEEIAEVIKEIAEIATLPPSLATTPAATPASSTPSTNPKPNRARTDNTVLNVIAATSPVPVQAQSTGNRRAHQRHEVDTRVNLTLVRGAITMPGRILNLSQGGCRLRTDEHFKVGIYTPVEAEFFLHGLPFRLAGVSQAIMDRNTIGVRFLNMSNRKREHLTELIAEIEDAELDPDHPDSRSRQPSPAPGQP